MTTVRADRLYDDDFLAWTRLQAKKLRRFGRTRPNVGLDVRHIAEEIADLGKERRDSLRSWTARIIEHLLLEHCPARDPRRGWIDEVVNFRSAIEHRPTPSLRRDLERHRQWLYAEARRNLQRKLERYGETEIVARFPERCPWTVEQILGDFWPLEPN